MRRWLLTNRLREAQAHGLGFAFLFSFSFSDAECSLRYRQRAEDDNVVASLQRPRQNHLLRDGCDESSLLRQTARLYCMHGATGVVEFQTPDAGIGIRGYSG
jgi:hypothetical protein